MSVPSADITNGGNLVNYPSEWVSAEQKLTPEWGLQYIQAAHNDWLRNQNTYLRTKQNTMLRNRLYADGNQSEDIYKTKVLLNKSKSFINLNWEIVDIIPKYVDIMLGYFMRLSERIEVNAIDEEALNVVEQEKALLQAKVILQEELQKMNAMMGKRPDPSMQAQPQTLEEVQLYMQHGYKLNEEIDLEETLALISFLNQLEDELKKQFLLALIIDGEGGMRRYRDQQGRIKFRNVDMVESMVGYSLRHDRKDGNKFGEYLYMTIGEIRKMTDKFTEDDLKTISASFFGQFDNPAANEFKKDYKFGDFPFDKIRCKILDIEFCSTSTFKWERRTRPNGSTRISQVSFDRRNPTRPNNDLVSRNAEVWYKGFWIVGTTFMWNYGLAEQVRGDYAHPVQRGEENLSESYSGFTFYRPYKKSIVQRMIPFADGIQLAWLKAQNSLARARPAGVTMELGGLEEVGDGKGQKFTPLEIREIYDQTGDILWRRKDADDPDASPNQMPFQELKGGAGPVLAEAFDTIQKNLQLMGFVSGISEGMDASLPPERQAAVASKIAAQGTSNIMSTLYSGWTTSKQSILQCTAQMLQEDARNGVIHSGYMQAVGAEKAKMFKATSDISIYNMGIQIISNPGEDEIQFLEAQIVEALNRRDQTGVGGIELEDAFAVRQMMKTSLKAAEQLLVMRRAMRKRQDMQDQQQAAQQKAMIDQQSSQAATQNAAMLEKAKSDEKIRVIQAQGEETRKTNRELGNQALDKINEQGVQKGAHIMQEGELKQAMDNKKVIDKAFKK